MTDAALLMAYRPGSIVMHRMMYDKLCPLMKVQRRTDRIMTFWNDVPVFINDAMPTNGWYVVPGSPA